MLISTFKYRPLVHITGWIIFFITPLLLYPTHEFATALTDPSNILSLLIRNILWMALFYVNLLYFTPQLLKKKEVIIFLVSILAVIVVVSLVNSSVHHFFSQLLHAESEYQGRQNFPGQPEDGPGMMPPNGFPPPQGFRHRPRPFGFGPPGPFFSNFLISLMMVSISTSVVLWDDWIKAREQEQERAFQKVSSELSLLKLQISPHFLFNTLNNIRWLIRSGSNQAETSVVKLSHLLRYVLYQTDLEKVSLEKETDHLKDYIALQQMRLTDSDSILFVTEGVDSTQNIVPLLLIPLVENVFKYGEFTDAFQNKIFLKVTQGVLKFSTQNKIAPLSSEKNGKDHGIGLENVRRRLTLHYPDRHVLTILEAEGIFNLALEVIL